MVNKLEWEHVSLSFVKKDGKTGMSLDKHILQNLSGAICSGQLLAIMGPTGCGKTSLMNVLSGRIPFNRRTKLNGYIYYNGEYLGYGMASKSVAYVAQNEHIFAFLTVRETLSLAAYFHSPLDMGEDQRTERVDAVMRELGLSGVADTILGNESRRGVSGGEYRRVLIGRELIKNPSTIFLDEPTSGLDSFQALSVMDTMKKLAINNRIVVSVIHQPRSSIFAMFDRLLLLSDGKLMYFGPANQAMAYFSSLGFVCPQHFNPADYFLDILSINMKSPEVEFDTRSRINYFEKSFAQVKDSIQIDVPSLERRSSSRGIASNGGDVAERVPFSKAACASWFKDFGILIWRANANIYRNYGAIIIRGLTTLFFAVLVSLIYRDLAYDQKGIQNRTGLLYFVLINQGFSPLIGTLNAFPNEKQIVTREVMAGSYRFSSYYVSRVIAALPEQLIFVVFYCIIIYWSTGLNPHPVQFFVFLAIVAISTFNATALGFLISAISPNATIANAIGPPVFIILLLYGGFYINASSLPVGSVWVRNLSLVYWGFQALIINEFTGERFVCPASTPDQCRTTGEQVIASYSFQDGSISLSAAMLAVLMVGFFILGYFGLLLGQQRYRRIKPSEDEHESDKRPEPPSLQTNHLEEAKALDGHAHAHSSVRDLEDIPI